MIKLIAVSFMVFAGAVLLTGLIRSDLRRRRGLPPRPVAGERS